ncbi:MAG: ComEA family DNA-binding protein [Acidimicrobiia bacterium]|nr:ComEA family DNA-binding protein [Acidimicrobiia bacterium]MYB24469.1 ComEA family DNA-binding protein [Acidimicrobiia bacterium]MYE68154.1 ComEA family DNA-binding protein [Acidimicrobiia bacterium]MYJ14402.1 ComEA family DNA-binding protein [Acidimicrobiia bacterium]
MRFTVDSLVVEPATSDAWERPRRWLEAVSWRAAAGVAAVALVAVGGCLALRSEPRDAAVVLPRASAVAPTPVPAGTAVPQQAEIVVHAAGAVARPGVYRLAATARVVDLLEAAGGPGDGADLDGINLAAPLTDGARVHVPAHGQEPPAELDIVEAPPAPPDSEETPGAPVDLNTADAAELESLPGIGPVTAAAIIAHRSEEGPFPSVESLQEVTGIGPVKLSRIADLVTAGQ